jgi:CRISPR-associated protein Cas2
MANMVVISTSAVPGHVRGALTRWLTEPAPGLYIGTVSARVREGLWSAVAASVGDEAAACVHPAENEQRYMIRTAGKRRALAGEAMRWWWKLALEELRWWPDSYASPPRNTTCLPNPQLVKCRPGTRRGW